MQMEYRGCVINLLDTPGHQDFSEDTYRVLTAVDAALMVIDAANGVEPQTRRLLQVCRARNTPILTFVNKMDREVQEPLALMDEIERELGMSVVPFTWPVGMGKRFHGVMDLRDDADARVHAAARTASGDDDEILAGLDNPAYAERFGDAVRAGARTRSSCCATPRRAFDEAAFLAGRQTPMFFGSAINNFGVQRGARRAGRPGAAAGRRASRSSATVAARRAEVHRRRLQDPGQHGPGAPRPDRVRARRARATSSAACG